MQGWFSVSGGLQPADPLSVRIRREDFYNDRRAAAAASLNGGRVGSPPLTAPGHKRLSRLLVSRAQEIDKPAISPPCIGSHRHTAGHDRWPMRGTLLPIDADFRDSKVPRC